MVKNVDLTQVKGDTKNIVLNFTDSSGVAIDITGATIYLTVKSEYTDADPGIFQKVVTSHTNPTGGQSTITVLPADTSSVTPGNYKYDIQLTEASLDVSSVLVGVYSITNEVTLT